MALHHISPTLSSPLMIHGRCTFFKPISRSDVLSNWVGGRAELFVMGLVPVQGNLLKLIKDL